MTRRLNEDERAVLRRILAGRPGLLAQVDRAEVVATWAPGSVSVDIEVPGAIPDGDLNGVFPRLALVEDAGEFLVWVAQGVLSGLEYATYLGEYPTSLPDAETISFPE
ncbi:hypothetical protein ACFORO_08120 [Amycolatopsis halotolerans]|uniref:Uncharacterized protein n=1 Tax=Amycolatopsis halotolerans TaxID=330083 RepID=A0ABV7QDT6_9PSEU